MLSTDEFKTFAGEFVVYAHITTHLEGREHENLLSEKGFNSFPSLAAMNADGDVIAKLTGSRDVAGFREMMAAGAKYEELRAKPDKTLADELYLLTHDIEMGNVDLAAARTRAEALEGLDEAQQHGIDGLLTDFEIKAALGQPKSRAEAEELARKAGITFAGIWAQGREPVSDEAAQPFYILILDHAHTVRDIALFERALAKLKERFGTTSGTEAYFKLQDERLEGLKAGDEDAPNPDEPKGEGDG